MTDALREIQVLDPTATPDGEQLEDGLRAAADLLDTWRVQRLTIGGVTISAYGLVSGTQSYTIGSGGVFNQTYPESIDFWSVIPDDTATDPYEHPRWRPVTADVWQQYAVKTQTGEPRVLYFDRLYSAGLGRCWFYPIPDNSNQGVRLYQSIPVVTALVAGTTYDLRPGAQNALTLSLAVTLFGRYGKAAVMTESLIEREKSAFGWLKASNIVPKPSPMRSEYIIGDGAGRRTHQIYTDS